MLQAIFIKQYIYMFIIKQTLTQFVYTINMFFEKNLTFDKKIHERSIFFTKKVPPAFRKDVKDNF